MSYAALIAVLACLAAALVLAAWEALRVAGSACQWFRGLLASSRPAGRKATALPASEPGGAVKGVTGRAAHGPRGEAPRSSTDLLVSYLPAVVPVGAIVSAEPDFDAFMGGAQTVLYVALATAAALVAITFFRKWFG